MVCQYNSQDCNRLKAQLIADMSGLSVPVNDLTAAQNLLRTNVHPQTYATLQRLNALIGHSTRRIRLIAERIGYAALPDLSTSTELSEFVELYRHAASVDFSQTDITVQELAITYKDLLTIAALYHEGLFGAYVSATYATLAYEDLEQAFASSQVHAQAPVHQQLRSRVQKPVWNRAAVGQTLANFLTRHRDLFADQQHAPVYSSAFLDPYILEVEDGGTKQQIRLPLHVTIHDPYSQRYSIELSHDIEPVIKHELRERLHIPWESASKFGMTLMLRTHHAGVPTQAVQYYITPAAMSAVREQGHAAQTLIGVHHDIRVHPEYFHGHHLEHADLPQEPLAGLRVNNAVVEIRKLYPDAWLTVFV